MFKEKVHNYLINDMCINLEFINKILDEFSKEKQLIEDYLEYLIDYKFPHDCSEIGSSNWCKNEKDFNSYYIKFWKKNNIDEEKEYYQIFDNFMRTFLNFKRGGIIHSYEKMDAEDSYYPKIIVKKYYGKEEDITELQEPIIIFRGTSIEEYDSGNFSQSWSLSCDEAEEFAFKYYKWNKENLGESRVVLKTEITKSDIFYFNKSNREKEVVISPKCIKKEFVKIVKEGIIE
jgi:hypothetical protein